MTWREIIPVCFEIRTVHINILCGHNTEVLHINSGGK
jgi:hypothetical protein